MEKRFQSLPFKRNLQRYITGLLMVRGCTVEVDQIELTRIISRA
jgi:hypothetical protein